MNILSIMFAKSSNKNLLDRILGKFWYHIEGKIPHQGKFNNVKHIFEQKLKCLAIT